MNIHIRKGLFVAAAVLGALAVFAAGFFVAVGVRSVVAGPGASPGGPVPSPGHQWTEIQDHGIDGGDYWLGTTDNNALELHVNSSRALRLEPGGYSPNVIGGYSGNNVTGGVVGATIGGGGHSGYIHQVTGDYGTVGGGDDNMAVTWATVGGGVNNTASDQSATVGGGQHNTASGGVATVGGGNSNTAGNECATVAGGCSNTASGWQATVAGGSLNQAISNGATVGGGQYNTATSNYATVGGGDGNTTSDYGATIGGGHDNVASAGNATVGGGLLNEANGYAGTVPGGRLNTAGGDYSFAAGRRAKANNIGCFVWADSTDADFASTTVDQFLVRASGGVIFDVGYSSFQIGGQPGNLTVDGNVGIGTASPGQKLDVSGNTKITGTLFVGYERSTSAPSQFPSVGCSAGTVVLGGGCSRSTGNGYMYTAYPTANGYVCGWTSGTGVAIALCARLGN